VLPDHCLYIGLVDTCARLGHAPELRAVVLHEDELGAAALLKSRFQIGKLLESRRG
jgi:hypothetical protein